MQFNFVILKITSKTKYIYYFGFKIKSIASLLDLDNKAGLVILY